MAQNMLGAVVDTEFTNSLRAVPDMGGGASNLTDSNDYTSVTSLRNALAAYDALTYTAKVLDTMTVNDMVFAVRNCQDPKTISDFIVAQTVRS